MSDGSFIYESFYILAKKSVIIQIKQYIKVIM